MAEAILIAGPTASGKSALAFRLAKDIGGAIINADSQQVFRDWRILTARPSADEEAEVPHFLYGHLPLTAEYSVGHWLRDLAPVLETCRERGLIPIITGGTGLYFKGLTEGMAPIPPTPPEVREKAEILLDEMGLAAFASDLARRDPRTAAVTDMENPMRVLRAWEVLEVTGRGIAEWRDNTLPPLLPLPSCDARVVIPERDALYARCDARFDDMLSRGVLDEAAHVRSLGLPPGASGLKALGASELLGHLDGGLALSDAVIQAKTATRRYAKRQLTWARNQMASWTQIVTSAD